MVPQNTPQFYSRYASRLYAFVEHKRREGYRYNGEVKELQRFDRYLNANAVMPDNYSIEIIYDWLKKRPSESDKTFSTRNSVYRQFHNYLVSENDVVLPKPPNAREKLKSSSFVPYIFTHGEISRILKAVDNESNAGNSFQRNAPLLFRVLYGTGLRINEALSLTTSDIVYQGEVLLIREAKNDNTRLVTMSSSLAQRVNDYLLIRGYTGGMPLFQNNKGTQLCSNTVYDWFRLALWKAGIPHRGRGRGPRLHDLRHTFAVHSLQAAVASETDPNAFLPLLSTYLGHKTLSATERYLRLTAEAFPTVIHDMGQLMDSIIPEVIDYER